jgi:anti-sigma B factor antagonist
VSQHGGAALTAKEVARMLEDRFTTQVVGGVPVVATPQEIDINNAAGLRAALLDAAAPGPGTLVVDMSATQFCDAAGLHVLVRAHQQAQARGGELLLVLPTTTVLRIFAIAGIDRMIPNFPTLDEALAQAPAAAPPARSSPVLTGSGRAGPLAFSLSATDVSCGDARSGRKIGSGCCPLTPSEP